MNSLYYEKITSTQKILIEKIKKNEISLPIVIWSEYQIDGIGSRGDRWIGKKGNLFFSFAYKKDEFSFVPIESLSIYFGWIFKKTLNELGSKCIMKWPNDIYLIDKKIGGVITAIVKNSIVCGIGLNTKFAPDGFGYLDIDIKNGKILKTFFSNLEKKCSFKKVIYEFKEEFEKYKDLFLIKGNLAEDGSLIINQKRIYSKR